MRAQKSIIIRPYDKGVGFSVDDKEHYTSRIIKEINKPDIYSLVTDPADATHEIDCHIRTWTDQCSDQTLPKFQVWMIDNKAGFRYFYVNTELQGSQTGKDIPGE